jgi:methionyl aminopeptidase
MEKEVLDSYFKAAKVWGSCIKLAEKKAKEGVKLLELAKEVEKAMHEEGCAPAFPMNLSLNEEAAHFTPLWNDETTLKKTDLLKIDIGVQHDGYICDGAISVNLDNKHAKQIEANELALANAISLAEFGKPVEGIGAEIERTLKEKGFEPVRNLGGHGLTQYNIHAGPSIPNHSKGSTQKLEEGVIAIEPFASTGEGFIGEVTSVEIFSLEHSSGVRNPHARELVKIAAEYNGLPFAERWLREKTKLGDFAVTIGLRELIRAGCFHAYPGLKESKGAMVSQA